MFKNFHNQKKNGYTMIEILVVMSIIAFITVAAWYYIDYSRKLARDTKRVADLSQIQKGLEMFRNEKGRYPDTTDSIDTRGECIGDNNLSLKCGVSQQFEIAMANFLQNMPADPLHNHNCGIGGGGTCSSATPSSNFFYSYDPSHPDGLGSTAPVLCFNKSETGKYNCSGSVTIYNPLCGVFVSGNGEMTMAGAAYCIILR